MLLIEQTHNVPKQIYSMLQSIGTFKIKVFLTHSLSQFQCVFIKSVHGDTACSLAAGQLLSSSTSSLSSEKMSES